MSLFSALSSTHSSTAAVPVDAFAGLSYIQSLRSGSGGAMAITAAANAEGPPAASAASSLHRPRPPSASKPRSSTGNSPTRPQQLLSLPQLSREQHQQIISSTLAPGGALRAQLRRSAPVAAGSLIDNSNAAVPASSSSVSAAPSMLASPLHQFVFSGLSSPLHHPPPAASFGFGLVAQQQQQERETAESLSGWAESDGVVEQQLRDSHKSSLEPSSRGAALQPKRPSAAKTGGAASTPSSGSFTARPPSKPQSQHSGPSTSGLREEKEGSRLAPPAAVVPPSSTSGLSPFAQSVAAALNRFQPAGTRTLEDEMLELENERRKRNKQQQRSTTEDNSSPERTQQEEKSSTTTLPKVAGAEPPPEDALAAITGGAAAAAARESTALLAGLPLPSLVSSSSPPPANLSLPIDLLTHTELFHDKLACYTHLLTSHLQSNLDKIMHKIRLNEETKLTAARKQLQQIMTFYHRNEGKLYDVFVANREQERALALAQAEAEELSIQTSLIREDFDGQRVGFVAQLQALHSGERQHHEFLLAHSKMGNEKIKAKLQQGPTGRRGSKGNNANAAAVASAATGGDKSVSPERPQSQLKPTATGNTSRAGGSDSCPRSSAHLSVGGGAEDDGRSSRSSSSVPSSVAAQPSQHPIQVKIGVLRSYWQNQFVSVRLLREELSQLRSQLSTLDTELGHRVEGERLKIDHLQRELQQMEINHAEQLSVRAEELTALQDEAHRLNEKREGILAEQARMDAQAAEAISREEACWTAIQSATAARTELAQANSLIHAELEKRFYAQQIVKLDAVRMSQEAFSWVRSRFIRAVACPSCGEEQQSSTVIWATGESECESCAFKQLFPPAFQKVVLNMHKAIISGRGGGAAQQSKASSSAASSTSSPKRKPTSGVNSDSSADATPASSIRRLHSVLSGVGREHLESSACTTARRVAAADDVVAETTGLGELGTRLLASMAARNSAEVEEQDGDAEHDPEASAAAASVGDRIRRGSLGGIVDALIAMNDAAAASASASARERILAPASSTSVLSPGASARPLQELSEWNVTATTAARSPSALTPSASSSTLTSASASTDNAAAPPFTLLWLRNRTVDLFLARLSAYRSSLDSLSASASAVQPLMQQFESSLSNAHHQRMEVARSALQVDAQSSK